MAINYRNEVDSGKDRKRTVEALLIKLLKEGVPEEIIKQMPLFNKDHSSYNPRHLEMIENLKKGYSNKEEQILETYGGYSKELSEQVVPDRYSKVSHPVGGELYPMTYKEATEKFKERDNYVNQINKLKKLDIKELEKEKNKIINAITKYKAKFPVIDKLIDAIAELDEIQAKSGDEALKIVDYTIVFKKNGLNPNEITKYDNIYNNYNILLDSLSKINVRYEMALDGKVRNEEIDKLISKKNELETEIVLRNTKLVNGFIRQKFKNLLVDQDDLFQICYAGLWKAVKNHDYKKGFKFSNYAYSCMLYEVIGNFKELTGTSWSNYWNKKKILILLKNTSEMLGRNITINELAQLGFLDMSETRANNFLAIADERPFSDMFPPKQSYDEYEIEREYDLYFGDDEINDYNDGRIDEVVTNYDSTAIKNNLREDLEKVLDTLTPREKKVLEYRFGLDDGIPKTLDEVGVRFNVTRERIRQIEAKALRKLRHPSRARKIKDYLDDDFSEIQTKSY